MGINYKFSDGAGSHVLDVDYHFVSSFQTFHTQITYNRPVLVCLFFSIFRKKKSFVPKVDFRPWRVWCIGASHGVGMVVDVNFSSSVPPSFPPPSSSLPHPVSSLPLRSSLLLSFPTSRVCCQCIFFSLNSQKCSVIQSPCVQECMYDYRSYVRSIIGRNVILKFIIARCIIQVQTFSQISNSLFSL